jgi:hypothetical protein
MTSIELLRKRARGDALAKESLEVIEACWKLLMDSGQLELNPPDALLDFYRGEETDEGYEW